MMIKFFFTFISGICLLLPITVHSEEQFITVSAIGYGANDELALEDAFQNAIRNVNGVYVVAQSTLKNYVLSQEIYVNADAVISSHKLLQRRVEHGIIALQIEATVVKNKFAQFVKKYKKPQVSSTDIRNLLNHRRALANALKSMELIFQRDTREIFKVAKIGQLELDAHDDITSNDIKLKVHYQVEFNQKAYNNFKTKLTNLLDQVCIKQESYRVSNFERYSSGYIADVFLKKYQKDKTHKAIIFREVKSPKNIIFTCYLVPFQLFRQAHRRFFSSGSHHYYDNIICSQIKLRNGRVLTDVFPQNIGFHESPGNQRYMCFSNIGFYNGNPFIRHTDNTLEITLPKDEVEKIRSFEFFMRHGIEAQFLKAKRHRNHGAMNRLAGDHLNYVPALISMAEDFNDRSGCLERAALLGSTYAQEKLKWNNYGLGLEISNFDIISTRRELRHLQGKKIVSINGKNISNLRDLSQTIGQIPAGSSVELGFSDQKKTVLAARGKFNPANSASKTDHAENRKFTQEIVSGKLEIDPKKQASVTLSLPIILPGNVKLEMVKIPAGSFQMGSPEEEIGRAADEKQHKVVLNKVFWIGTYEITQEQYQAVMKLNPSIHKAPNRPVENLTWHNAREFCRTLTALYAEKLPFGYRFDLPTEAQWEYACRAGTTAGLNSNEEILSPTRICINLNRIGWYDKNNIPRGSKPVGLKQPNRFGLFDCHGNIGEWCRDWYAPYRGKETNPRGPAVGRDRVYRGGHFNASAKDCRSASRRNAAPSFASHYLGFRVALVSD